MKKLLTIFNAFYITILTSLTSVSCLKNDEQPTTNYENSATRKQSLDSDSTDDQNLTVKNIEQASFNSQPTEDQDLTIENTELDSLESEKTTDQNLSTGSLDSNSGNLATEIKDIVGSNPGVRTNTGESRSGNAGRTSTNASNSRNVGKGGFKRGKKL